MIGHKFHHCTRPTTGRCSGCHEDQAGDCYYEALSCCSVCGCYEGSLLPACPGRQVTMEEQDAFYKHYCAGTGPFARATFDTVDVAKEHCYYRLHPKPWIDSSKGARILYDAVCDLWNHVVRLKREAQQVSL